MLFFTEITFYLESSVLFNTNNTNISNDIKDNGQKYTGRVGNLTNPAPKAQCQKNKDCLKGKVDETGTENKDSLKPSRGDLHDLHISYHMSTLCRTSALGQRSRKQNDVKVLLLVHLPALIKARMSTFEKS